MFSRSAEMLENVFMKICMKTLSFKVNMKGCQSLKFSYSCQSTATVRKRKKHTEILKKDQNLHQGTKAFSLEVTFRSDRKLQGVL